MVLCLGFDLGLGSGLGFGPDPAIAQPLQLGVPPTVSIARIERDLSSFTQSMGKRMKRDIALRTRSSFDTYRAALENAEFGIAFVTPFDYVKLRRRGTRYLPFARYGKSLSAIVVVRDPEIKTLRDLQGEVIAFPAATSTTTLLALYEINRMNLKIKNHQLRYYSEHESCIQALLIGTAKACVTVRELLHLISRDRESELHVIYETAPIPNVLLVLRNDLAQHRQTLMDFLVEYNTTVEGRRFLERFNMGGYVPARDSDYNVVEQILDEYVANNNKLTDE